MLELIKSLGAVIAAIGLCATVYQIRKGILWNKLSAAFTMFPNKEFADRERGAVDALASLDFNLLTTREPLQPALVDSILQSPNVYGPIKAFMNFFEDYALAARKGVIDPDAAYVLMADSLTRNHGVLKPLINRRRVASGRTGLWVNWELLADEWRLQLAQDDDDRTQKMQELQREWQRKADEIMRKVGRDPRNY